MNSMHEQDSSLCLITRPVSQVSFKKKKKGSPFIHIQGLQVCLAEERQFHDDVTVTGRSSDMDAGLPVLVVVVDDRGAKRMGQDKRAHVPTATLLKGTSTNAHFAYSDRPCSS